MTAERITVQKCPECGFAPRVSFWHGFDCSQPEVEQVTLLPLELVEDVACALDRALEKAEAELLAGTPLALLAARGHIEAAQVALDHLLAQAPELKGGEE